ncbi:hypothetical protein Tco_1560066 [Tanacetum coccineum]
MILQSTRKRNRRLPRFVKQVELASVEAQISLIKLEFSSCLFADLLMNLLRVSSIDCLPSPSEVSVLLPLDVLLCHFLEYYAISWMAFLALATVIVGMAPLESRIYRVGISNPL